MGWSCFILLVYFVCCGAHETASKLLLPFCVQFYQLVSGNRSVRPHCIYRRIDLNVNCPSCCCGVVGARGYVCCVYVLGCDVLVVANDVEICWEVNAIGSAVHGPHASVTCDGQYYPRHDYVAAKLGRPLPLAHQFGRRPCASWPFRPRRVYQIRHRQSHDCPPDAYDWLDNQCVWSCRTR